jgi:hypothetical protein
MRVREAGDDTQLFDVGEYQCSPGYTEQAERPKARPKVTLLTIWPPARCVQQPTMPILSPAPLYP